jgi:hypothetical protein
MAGRLIHRRRLCLRVIGILLPMVRGGNVTGVGELAFDPYARSNRLATGLVGVCGCWLGGRSVQSDGGGLGTNPSICACGII